MNVIYVWGESINSTYKLVSPPRIKQGDRTIIIRGDKKSPPPLSMSFYQMIILEKAHMKTMFTKSEREGSKILCMEDLN